MKWFAGVEWGTETHQVCVLDSEGKVAGERASTYGGERLASFADGEAGSVGVEIETPSGRVVESLTERGFAVYSINPKYLDRFGTGTRRRGRRTTTGTL